MENAQKFKKIFGGILSVGRRKSEDALRSLQALIQVLIIRFVEQNYSGVVIYNSLLQALISVFSLSQIFLNNWSEIW
jgi:hypothetical protein